MHLDLVIKLVLKQFLKRNRSFSNLWGMRYVQVGRAKSVQDMDGQLIKVNRDIHESKGVSEHESKGVILYIGCNGSITLLRARKILAMDHDLSSFKNLLLTILSIPNFRHCCLGLFSPLQRR